MNIITKYKIQNTKPKEGYIALTTVLIVGVVASVIMVSLLTLGLGYTRSSNSEYLSIQAKTLANACAEDALRQIRANTSFTATNTTINLGSGSCTYSVTNTGGTNRTIDVSGAAASVTRKLQIFITAISPKITISSWQEIP